ncbi:MAG: formate dehydrogenase accessory sulfurtransferase FdhD [Bacteroidota bacterium]
MSILSHTQTAGISDVDIHTSDYQHLHPKTDIIAIEEPLEIQLMGSEDVFPVPISITMRTPGQDQLLALGFLFTEGILASMGDIEAISLPDENRICIQLAKGATYTLAKTERNFYTTSSCGVCGKASIEAIRIHTRFDMTSDQVPLSAKVLQQLPIYLQENQSLFSLTGGIHAAALFSHKGTFQMLQEDVGRHNALDKLVGQAFQEGLLPLQASILLLSGRASFELIQKAAMAGIPVVAALGAPSSLAVSLAEEQGMTLIGFLKPNTFNIYTGHERLLF